MKACIIDCTADKFMTRGMSRRTCSSAYSIGMKCIERDFVMKFGGNKLPVADAESLRYFDIAFLPLTSIQEVESFLTVACKDGFRKNRTRIIAGGAGCINIFPLIDYIDIAVFGRCDNSQITGIIDDKEYPNVWRKDDDPECTGSYGVGDFAPPKHKFETGTIGCRMKCAYCHYTHVRRHDSKPYSPERGAAETDIWASDFTRPRVYVTAIDGLSEEARKRVNKPITDEFLLKKISEIYSDMNRGKTVGIKFYNIIGFPWETPESVKRDFKKTVDMLASLDRKTGKWRCKITFQHTPFSPEPLTPMENCFVNPGYDFRDALKYEYKGIDITIKNTPFLQGTDTRKKRIAINRCGYDNRHEVIKFITDKGSFPEQVLYADNPVRYLKGPVDYNHNKFEEWNIKS